MHNLKEGKLESSSIENEVIVIDNHNSAGHADEEYSSEEADSEEEDNTLLDDWDDWVLFSS